MSLLGASYSVGHYCVSTIVSFCTIQYVVRSRLCGISVGRRSQVSFLTQKKYILLRMSPEKWLLYSAGRLKPLQLIVFVRIKSNLS